MGRRGGRGGGRGGRGGGGEGGGGGFEDQYGEAMMSQDRDSHRGCLGRGGTGGMGGGGEAGGSRGSDLKVTAHVPAFLKAHSHLLHGKVRKEAEPVIDTGPDDDSDFERDDGGALTRAIAENPALAAQDASLQRRADKAKAEEEKAAGNRAFGAKEYDKAIGHFTLCIRLDPENEVYYSNRSAALLALGRHRDALADGKKCVDLRPAWPKGYARVGAAFSALEQFTEAKEAYNKALDLEPDDAQLQDLAHRAEIAERKAVDQRKHRFRPAPAGAPAAKKARSEGPGRRDNERGGASGPDSGKSGDGPVASGRAGGKAGKAPLLSFGEDEDD